MSPTAPSQQEVNLWPAQQRLCAPTTQFSNRLVYLLLQKYAEPIPHVFARELVVQSRQEEREVVEASRRPFLKSSVNQSYQTLIEMDLWRHGSTYAAGACGKVSAAASEERRYTCRTSSKDRGGAVVVAVTDVMMIL